MHTKLFKKQEDLPPKFKANQLLVLCTIFSKQNHKNRKNKIVS